MRVGGKEGKRGGGSGRKAGAGLGGREGWKEGLEGRYGVLCSGLVSAMMFLTNGVHVVVKVSTRIFTFFINDVHVEVNYNFTDTFLPNGMYVMVNCNFAEH